MHSDFSPVFSRRGWPSRAPLAQRARRGFALIVTLGLMTLLLLLVLTLTTLVRINMVTATSNLVSAQARQNALLAAYIGMGQLQKFAGPDQRATANAYLCAGGQFPMENDNTDALQPFLDSIYGVQTIGNNNTPTINEAPIKTGGTWFWTGVWGPGVNPLALYTGQGTAYNGTPNEKAPMPILLNWLVSGDEGTPLSSNFTANGVVGPPPGQNGEVAFTPATSDPGGGISSNTIQNQYDWTSTTNDITILPTNPPAGIKGAQAAALLVGPNTAYTGSRDNYSIMSAAGNTEPSNTMIGPRAHSKNIIVAPIVNIHDATPDYIDATKIGITSGRYAWWVGDEGVKAKYTPSDPYVSQSTPTVATDAGQLARYRFWAPLRNALERMSGFSINNSYEKLNGVTPGNSTGASLFKQLLDPSQIFFVESTLVGSGPTNSPAGNTTDPEQTLGQNYFDFTTYSYGLLADSLRGGLRYDLTTAFQEPSKGTQSSTFLDSTNGLVNRAILPGADNNTAASTAATTEPNIVKSGVHGTLLQALVGPGGSANITFHGPNAPPPPGGNLSTVGGLRWDAIENFYNIAANNSSGAPVPVQAGSTIKAGITPLITQFRLRFGQMADNISEQYVSVEPEFVLANPYTFPITDAGGGMDLGFRINTSTVPPGYPANDGWEWAGGLNSRNDVRVAPTPSGESIALGYDTTQSFGFGGKASGADAFGANFSSTSGGANSAVPGYYPFLKDPVDYPGGYSGGFNSVLDNIAFHISKGANSTFAPGEAKVYSLNPNPGVTFNVATGYSTPEGIVSAVIGAPLLSSSGSSAIANGSIAAVSLAWLQPTYNASLGLPSPYYLVRDTGINTAAGKYKQITAGAADPASQGITGLWPGHKYGYISTMDPGVAFTLELRSDVTEPHIQTSNSDTQQTVYSIRNPNLTVSTGVAGPGQNVLQSITNMDLTGAGMVAGNKNTQPDPKGYVPPFALGQGYRRGYLGTGTTGGSMPVFLSAYEHMLAFPGNLGDGPSVGTSASQNMVAFWVDSGVTIQSPRGWFDPSQYLTFSLYKDFNLRATNMALPPFASFNSPWAGNATTPTYSPSGLVNNIVNYMTTPPYGRVFDEGPGQDDNTISGQEEVSFSQNALGRSPVSSGSGFSSNPNDAAWGYANSVKGNGKEYVALYSLPQKGANPAETLSNGTVVPDVPMMSLGQLTHADFTQDDIWASVGYQPGNAFGNSYFSPYVTRGSVIQAHPNQSAKKVLLTLSPLSWLGGGSSTAPFTLPTTVNAYDISYLMNVALWDRFFFSTYVPSAPVSAPYPANSRMAFAAGYSASAVAASMQSSPNPLDPVTGKPTFKAYIPARYLMVDGAFNINSTSFEAWRSVLSALRKVPYNSNASGVGSGGPVAYFPRAMASANLTTLASSGTPINSPMIDNQLSTGNTSLGVKDPQSYAGFRALSDDQIDILAAKIVQQVHQRGPFLSLAQFVNRSLVYPYNGGTQQHTLIYSVSGPLQAAIDMTTGAAFPSFNSFLAGLTSNAPGDTTPGVFTPWVNGAKSNSNSATSIYPDGGLFIPGTRAYDSQYDAQNGHPSANPYSLLAGIPGWLTQADLLQVLAPILTARSDTFTIRSYGEVLSPAINQANLQLPPSNLSNPIVSDPSSVLSRAWCELVVQRMPDYVATDPKSMDDPSATTGFGAPNPSASKGGPLHPVNAYFGRRFRIVSIRWLSADDI